jgi:hypothetical protein
LTFSNVKELEWAASLRSDFLTIQISEEVAFGPVVEYGKVIDPMLKAPNAPEDEVNEEARLQQEVVRARGSIEAVRTTLVGLSSALGQPLPDDVSSTLDSLTAAFAIDGEYQRSQLLAQLRQHFPAAADLSTAWNRASGWFKVSSHAAELTRQAQFIANLVSRLGAAPGRYEAIVRKAGLEIQPRLNLSELLAAPSTVDLILQQAESVRAAYENEYRLHHRDYFAEISKLRDGLAELDRQARALTMLNKLRCAGPVRLSDPVARVERLEKRLALCPFAADTTIAVGSNATCQHPGCSLPGLDPLAQPPRREVDALQRELTGTIRDRVNAVKAKAVIGVLEKSGSPDVGTFIAAVQAGQFDSLLEVLDERLVALIDNVLDLAKVRTVPNGVLARVSQRYPAIQRSQIGDVVSALRSELEAAFAEAERANPDATIQLQLSLERPE